MTVERDPKNVEDVTAEVIEMTRLSIEEGFSEILGIEHDGEDLVVTSYDEDGETVAHWKVTITAEVAS